MCSTKNGHEVIVLPFDFLVDVVFKIHTKMAQIGRHKLEKMIMNKFFHPSMKKIIKDVTRTCTHCQLYKVSSQLVTPPTLKINARYPFDLLAIDLLMFPRSSGGNSVILVCVDHFSKFLYAKPLRDKKSSSVCKVLNNSVFPCMPRLPSRMLSDNGPEFRSSEFESTLSAYNISHVFSTRYRAQGNGAVERSNRTIIEFVKGVVQENPKSWDTMLSKAVIVYNNTWHASIKMSPSECILSKAHSCDANIPVDTNCVETWKDAHADFKSFEVDQKVARKIQKIGNRLQYKLGKKFTGPFKVIKVQGNGVSYEISDGEKVLKAHHKQLKPWFDPPDYLRDYMRIETNVQPELSTGNSEESSDSEFNYACPIDAVMLSESNPDEGDNERTSVSNYTAVELELCNDSLFDADFVNEFRKLRDKYWPIVEVHRVGDDQVMEAINDTERSVLNWSFSSEEIDFVLPEENVPRYSTRELDDDDASMPDTVDNVSPIIAEDSNSGKSNGSLSSFLMWLEQSLLVHEELVERIAKVSQTLNDAWLEEVTDILSLGEIHERDDRTDILTRMSRHVNHVRESIADYRQNEGSLWRTRFEPNDNNDVIDEASDRIEELPVDSSKLCRRVTRSQGPVQEYPNVQKSTLEYRIEFKS